MFIYFICQTGLTCLKQMKRILHYFSTIIHFSKEIIRGVIFLYQNQKNSNSYNFFSNRKYVLKIMRFNLHQTFIWIPWFASYFIKVIHTTYLISLSKSRLDEFHSSDLFSIDQSVDRCKKTQFKSIFKSWS